MSSFPCTVNPVPSSAGVPLPGGLGVAVLLLFSEPRSPLLPGRCHRCALQQRAGEPAAPYFRRQGKESHRDSPQTSVYRRHALPPSLLGWPPSKGLFFSNHMVITDVGWTVTQFKTGADSRRCKRYFDSVFVWFDSSVRRSYICSSCFLLLSLLFLQITTSGGRLCQALKAVVVATKGAAQNYPSVSATQEMVDHVAELSQQAAGFSTLLQRLAEISSWYCKLPA